MKQVLQNVKSGELELADAPAPAAFDGGAAVRTRSSIISAGTEKMLIELASKSLLGKAQARPDLVKQVIDKAKKEGWRATFKNVMSKMEKPMPLGYSASGVVESVGAGVSDLSPGDRVAVAGAGYACHAEINAVPKNLIAKIPPDVSFEEAAYSTIASIALQGVRLAKPELGDLVVVSGLGLIGIIAVQLLKANGCRVAGIDTDASKVKLALEHGLDLGIDLSKDDPVSAIDRFTGGRGADHTLIAAATKSNQPIELAGEVTRRKGQVVAVGAVGMNIPRDVYYKKEIEVKISMSYGPGRYDPSYEEGGIDYPYDYVRWTEQRNMEAVLALMAQKKLRVESLTSHRFPIERALEAYEMIKSGSEPYVGVALTFSEDKEIERVVRLKEPATSEAREKLRVGFVGAGNYAALHLIPHLSKRSDVVLRGLATATGANARRKADKFGFEYCAADYDELLGDEAIDAIFIATRHRTHADYAVAALEKGKRVFVEKPMVVNEEQLDRLVETYREKPGALMVGLNRRFAPMTESLKNAFEGAGPKQMIYRVNSGHIPTSSWLHEPEEGGGMLVGEMCHFVDLMTHVAGAKPVAASGFSMTIGNATISDLDNVAMSFSFADGSVGSLLYNTVGDKSAPKERLEVYGGGNVGTLDDFRELTIFQKGKRSKTKAANQNKGQAPMMAATVEAFRAGAESPIPFDELTDVMRAVFAARRSIVEGTVVEIAPTRLERE